MRCLTQARLGAAMLHNGKPIAFASRALTEVETRYLQIEKELLTITFACRKFNDYIYGQKIVVETDDEPLITIMKKPLHSAPMRLQKMKLQLQRNHFKLVYKSGKNYDIADMIYPVPTSPTEDEVTVTAISFQDCVQMMMMIMKKNLKFLS